MVRFEHGPGQLLDEQWQAVGARSDFRDDFASERRVAAELANQSGRVALASRLSASIVTCGWPAQPCENSGRKVTISKTGSRRTRSSIRSSNSREVADGRSA